MIAESRRSTRLRYAAAIVSAGLSLAVAMIAAPAASAAPSPVSSCQTLGSPGSYALTADLAAVGATCIEITASDVRLDLAGHRISCTGSGFEGSCQVPGSSDDIAAGTPHGVRVAQELTEVTVRGPGTVDGFRNGVVILGGDAQVKGLTITAPDCDPLDCQRPGRSGDPRLQRERRWVRGRPSGRESVGQRGEQLLARDLALGRRVPRASHRMRASQQPGPGERSVLGRPVTRECGLHADAQRGAL
jgi:hypothetical protein